MAKLKLSLIEDDTPVKLTMELPAQVHRDLVAYGEAMAAVGGKAIDPAKLIAPMLSRFMQSDRVFTRGRNPQSRG